MSSFSFSLLSKAQKPDGGGNPTAARRKPALGRRRLPLEERAAAYAEALRAANASAHPPLPPCWRESVDAGGRACFSYADDDDDACSLPPRTTALDPRFLPAGWTMTLDEEGVPLFVSAACPAGCRDDPRGMPRGWRLIGDEGGRPVFANDTKRFNTFVDPRGLPDGFAVDQAASAEGSARRTFYMDHRTQLTSWQDPRATAPPSSLQKWCATRAARARPAAAAAPLLVAHRASAQAQARPARVHPSLPRRRPPARRRRRRRRRRRQPARAVPGAPRQRARGRPVAARRRRRERDRRGQHGHAAHRRGVGVLVGLVELLLAHGADLGATDRWGCAALPPRAPAAARRRRRPRLHRPPSRSSATPAMRAAVVSMLVGSGADVDVQDQSGLSPLMVAASAGGLGVVKQRRRARGATSPTPTAAPPSRSPPRPRGAPW